jgi:Flp pilus assembly protein TadB
MMLVTYALEERSHWFVLAFAGACASASTYGVLIEAWPFAAIEAVWSLVALRRWWRRSKMTERVGRGLPDAAR